MVVRAFESHEPQWGDKTYIDPAALVIGQVTLGRAVSVWPMTVLRADVNAIEVGDETNIQDGTIIHVNHAGPYYPEGRATIIGQQVTIGHQALIHACTIEDRCLIGMGARILDDVVIESEVVVGAGSLVPPNKVLERGYLYVGAPVRRVRALTEEEKEKITYSAVYYAQLAERHANG